MVGFQIGLNSMDNRLIPAGMYRSDGTEVSIQRQALEPRNPFLVQSRVFCHRIKKSLMLFAVIFRMRPQRLPGFLMTQGPADSIKLMVAHQTKGFFAINQRFHGFQRV